MARLHYCLMVIFAVACSRPEPTATHATKHQAPSGSSRGVVTTDHTKQALEASPEASTDSSTLARLSSPASAAPAASAHKTPALSANSGNASAGRSATDDLEQPAVKLGPIAQQPCQLLAVGDSLTDPKSGGGGYLEPARQRCGCRLTNLGKGGAMVNQIRARLLAHLAQTPNKYSHVVIFGGVNDLYSDLTANRSVAKIEADLTAMYQAARQHGARVIAVTVTPWGGFRRYFSQYRWQNTLELNRWIRSSPGRAQTDRVIDGESLLSCGQPEQLCEQYAKPYRDGLHFGPGGHQRLAAAMVHALGLSQCQSLPDDGSASD